MQPRFIFSRFLATALALAAAIFSACERNEYELVDPDDAGKWTLYSTSDGLPGNNVADIILDRSGRLWFVCPGSGIAKYEEGEFTSYRTTTSTLPSDAVNCVEEARDGTILVGTYTGISVYGLSDTWSSVIDPAVNSLYVNTIKVALNGWVWLGTQNQGLFLDNGSGYKKFLDDQYRNIYAIEEGSGGNIFIGTDTGLLRYNGSLFIPITVKDGLPSNRISALKPDSRQRMWIGTLGGKSASWLDSKGLHTLNLMASTDNIHIKDIAEDRQGNIWFATAEHGVIRYDGVICASLREFNGFPENNVNCAGEDAEGNLWFGLRNKGVVKYTLPLRSK